MQELVNRVQQAEASAGQAEQQAQQTQQVLAQMQQQQQQKGQTKGGNGRGCESGVGSFASKYQPPSFERGRRKVERVGPSVQILVRTIL